MSRILSVVTAALACAMPLVVLASANGPVPARTGGWITQEETSMAEKWRKYETLMIFSAELGTEGTDALVQKVRDFVVNEG
ncbi:MAG: hypothetical protein HY824_15625, partial [Acidobacteria bacterium]|nr:hypothetical protein [Acidobacteriota bacterium]